MRGIVGALNNESQPFSRDSQGSLQPKQTFGEPRRSRRESKVRKLAGLRPGSTDREPAIVILSSTYIPKYESSIPQHITDSILHKEQLPAEMPRLGSSMIEDFIMDKVKRGIATSEEIAEAFVSEDVLGQVRQFVQEVQTRSEALNWDDIFTMADAKEAQAAVITEMEAMGMSSDQVAAVAGTGIGIVESVGDSFLTNETAYTSRLQAVRKALDYITVFGNEVPFEQIIKSLMTSTVAHELGHKIDKVVNYATNNIPIDSNWDKNGDNRERKDERFAEYWGTVAIRGNETHERITQREWTLQMGKVTQVWNTIATHNATHEQKADLTGIFRAIQGKLGGGNKEVDSLLSARRSFYGGNEVENYASPYSRDVVLSAVQPAAG